MTICHLLKQLRVIQALMKEKLKVSEADWKASYRKHGKHSVFKLDLDDIGDQLSQIAKIDVSAE